MRALIIAFSTYSRVPMPHVNFNEKSMRYCMCCFPIVGLFIGACEAALYYLFASVFHMSGMFAACVLTVAPVLITGGIHLDGYMDTMDAKHSYKSKEEKLAILKDPHLGAFAVISAMVYFVLYVGATYQMLTYLEDGNVIKMVVPIAYIFVLERVLSGLSVVLFPKAKNDGMLAATACQADRKVAVILVILGLIFTAVSAIACPVRTMVIAGTGLICFARYRVMSEKLFGGTTGDLAGEFLQTTELLCILMLFVCSEIMK